jgi:hypothetical protein
MLKICILKYVDVFEEKYILSNGRQQGILKQCSTFGRNALKETRELRVK